MQVRPAGVGGGVPCEARPPRAVSIQARVDRKPPWGMGGAAAGLPPHYSRVDEPAWSGDLPGWDMTEAVTILRKVSTRYTSKEKS